MHERMLPSASLPRRARRILGAGYGACCGGYLALLLVVSYLATARSPSQMGVNVSFYLLSIALGLAGAILSARWHGDPRSPLLVSAGLIAWIPLFTWAIRAALDAEDDSVLPVFLTGAGLLVLHRALQTSERERVRGARVSRRRAVILATLLVSIAVVYLVEWFVRSRAEQVYEPFESILLEADRNGNRVGREEIGRRLRAGFGVTPEQIGETDRCTWSGLVNTYEITFLYGIKDGVHGCDRVVLTPAPRWAGWFTRMP